MGKGSLLCRPLILNKAKVVLAPASSAYTHSIKDVLSNASIASQIKVNLTHCLIHCTGNDPKRLPLMPPQSFLLPDLRSCLLQAGFCTLCDVYALCLPNLAFTFKDTHTWIFLGLSLISQPSGFKGHLTNVSPGGAGLELMQRAELIVM